ncbi:peptidoglycan editing factor PgeF [Cytobacillus massiliigabonensis]|uniref:peptidoglycan editing factor PgeF n=1 Tax=Cytobacillus massiliigabonensis TaxID=1871011 RepID=UPI000C815079|nr:peptidoglycan editing factor PgeF [Cytobacillus massiliigabonensis]
MEPFVLKDTRYFLIKEWMDKFPNLVAGFTSKNGGISKSYFSTLNLGLHVNDTITSVKENRQCVADALHFPVENWIGAEQTHKVNIEIVSKKDAGIGSLSYEESFKDTDGFFTYDKNILLTLCYADCVPLFFIHEESGAIGLAHAGWKGTVNGIAEEMVKLYKGRGMEEKEIHVIIGPSICRTCYIVDEPVITLVKKKLGDNMNHLFHQRQENQFELDLKEVNKAILLHAGVLEENIQVSDFCTSCHEEHFFSHRRDKGSTGRMMSFIGWKEDLHV